MTTTEAAAAQDSGFDPAHFRFDGRTAFVTGGASGIGFAVSQALVRLGASVTIGDVSPDAVARSARALGATGTVVDVRDTESVHAAVRFAAREGSLDVAVNCAGVRHNGPAEAIPDDEWEFVQAVNSTGLYRSCREEGAYMLEHGGGAIVNIASMSGSIVNRPQNQAAYNTSKAAAVMITKSLAAEWASRGVRVNSVSPGYTVTPMTAGSRQDPERMEAWHSRTPLARMARPAEIAAAVAFLASPAASFVVGHDLLVDGGYTAL